MSSSVIANARGWVRTSISCAGRAPPVALNLAEGYGEFSPREKVRFFRMSKRSCTESASALDYPVDMKIVREDEIRALKSLLRRITAILVNLIRKVESAADAREGT